MINRDPIRSLLLLLLLMPIFLIGCGGDEEPGTASPLSTNTLTLSSPAFAEGGAIPPRYTCNGADVPPPLAWEDGPDGARAYALIMDDPDAPGRTWVHWLLYNLPAETRRLPDGEPAPTGIQGRNSWGNSGYGGPCPPGGEHRYFFKLYALDRELELEPGADKAALLAAMEGHVLAQGELMGRYQKE